MSERVLSVRLRAIVDGYEAAMGRAATATEKVAATGKKMESAGKKMSVGFSLPMIAAGGFALRSATQFESAFAGVTKTVDGTAGELAGLRSGIIDMAKEIPSTREEISGVAAAAGQLGIQTPNILGFTRTMIDLGNSTDVAAADAAMSLAQLANITKMSQGDFDRLGSSVVALGNNFPTTESRIIEMSQRIASAGSQIGLTEPQILGFSAALSSVGIEAEAGGTAISRVMIMIAQAVSGGGAELEKWSQIAGMSGDAFANLFRSDSASAITAAIEGLGRLSDTGGDLFGVMEEIGAGDVRVGNALRSLAGSSGLLSRTLSLSTKAWDENLALTTEAGARYATTESRLKMTANRLTDVARRAGEAMFPAVNAALGIIDPLAASMGGLVDQFAEAPAPLQAAAGSILALSVAAGPATWALGKLANLYGPVVNGLLLIAPRAGSAAAAIRLWAQGMVSAAVAMRTASITGQGMTSALLGMGAAIGPQVALAAAIAGVGAALYLAKKRADELKASHLSGADAALQLAESAGIATDALRAVSDEGVEAPVVSDDDFRRSVEDTLNSLREFSTLEGQLGFLTEIGYGMMLRGVDPEAVMDQIERLADIAGIEIPISFSIDGDFGIDDLVESAKQRVMEAQRELEGTANVQTNSTELQMDAIARSATDLWKTGDAAGFVQVLAESEAALGDNASLYGYLADQSLRYSEVTGVSMWNTQNLADAMGELAGPGSTATEQQKLLLRSILDTAAAMEGGLTPQNLAAAAAQRASGESAAQVGQKYSDAEAAAEGLAGQTGELSSEQQAGAGSAEEFAAALDRVAANASFARLDFDAGAAAAQAFAAAMDQSTRTSARLGAGLKAGAALKSLREGLTGEKEIAGIREEAASSTRSAASAVDRLGDSVRRADPRMSSLQIRLDALAAAGEAFSQSIDSSSMLDDQVSSALSLGDAYRDFEKSYRRLPASLDMTALAMGKVRPRQAEAIQSMLGLGKAARDYLATLIEMGRADSEVAGEAARMRGEYEAMFRGMGLGEAQVRQYLEAMGLLPEQITTAIRVSGIEAARARLDAYMQLLEGRIPGEVATRVIASLEADDVEGAARMLADFARTNPATLDVDTSQLFDAASKISDVQASLWDLPRDIDPLKAMLGGYTDAQDAALEAVMQFGEGVQDYLSQVAHDGNAEEIRSQAFQIRDAFLAQIGMGDQVGREYDQMSEPARRYLDLIGMSDWQIDSAINLSGDAEATFRLQLYSDLLAGEIPAEISTQVLAAVDEGRLGDAADLLETWRTDMADGTADNPLIIDILADTYQASDGVTTFRDWVSQSGHGTLPVDADTRPATAGVQLFRDYVSTHPPAKTGVDADTGPARSEAARLYSDIESLRPMITIGAQLAAGASEAVGTALAAGVGRLAGAVSVAGNAGFGTKIAERGGADGDPLTPFALGGRVRGTGSNRSDSIRGAVSNGEYLVNAFAARAIGYERLDIGNRTGIIPGETKLLPLIPDMDQVMDRAAAKIAQQIPAGGDHLEFSGDIVSPRAEETPRRIAQAVGTGRFLTKGKRQ